MNWKPINNRDLDALRSEAGAAGDIDGVRAIDDALMLAALHDTIEISVGGDGEWTGGIRIAAEV